MSNLCRYMLLCEWFLLLFHLFAIANYISSCLFMFGRSGKVDTVPGWEKALKRMVRADLDFITAKLPEESDAAILRLQESLCTISAILGNVAHSLFIPQEIGYHIMSLTTGWENLWLDYDMLSAVHSAGVILPSHHQVWLDFEEVDKIDVTQIRNFSTWKEVQGVRKMVIERYDYEDRELIEDIRPLLIARRRLLVAMNHDLARHVYVCARIVTVDLLLRLPKISEFFLSSYFQTFPSFIGQTGSIANLMVSRLANVSVDDAYAQVNELIAVSAMSLLATVVCETNHVTQALSVLSANNPHSGLMANLLAHTSSAPFKVSKAIIYLLMCCIQNAKHPSSIATPPILRRILETLVDPKSHPDVVHTCCVCLEVALEFCPSAFTVLYRDLDALDRVVDAGLRHLNTLKTRKTPSATAENAENGAHNASHGASGSQNIQPTVQHSVQPVSATQDSCTSGYTVGTYMSDNTAGSYLSYMETDSEEDEFVPACSRNFSVERCLASIFSFLRCSFQTQEMHVGINLHEKLTAENSPVCTLFVDVILGGSAQFGKGPFNGCVTLVGNIIADDPLIVSTMVQVGIVEALVVASRKLDTTIDSKDNITAIFVGMCAICLHESGLKKLASLGTPLEDLLARVASGEFYKAGETSTVGEFGLALEDNRNMDDIGMVVGQSCDDVLRNAKSEMKERLVKAVVAGMRQLLEQTTADVPLHIAVISGLRVLYGGFLATSVCVELFVSANGLAMLNSILQHPKLEPGSLCNQVTSHGGQMRPHPIVAVFRQIGQRGAKIALEFVAREAHIGSCTEAAFWRFATASLMLTSSLGQNPSPTIAGDLLESVAGFYRYFPSVLGFYMSSSPASKRLISVGWTAVKNLHTSLAKLANVAVRGAVSSECTKLAKLGCACLCEVIESAPTEIEMVEIVSRNLVEDKNHSLRPLSLLTMWQTGGIAKLADLLTKGEASEPLLILFERLTSVKRITNSPLCKDMHEFSPESLSCSITSIIGQKCFENFAQFLEYSSLTSTAATAIIKIYSHTVMMTETATSPKKKRAKKVDHTHISEAVADKFVAMCVQLGDKGKCENAVAELIARHADYLGVSIVPQPAKKRATSKK